MNHGILAAKITAEMPFSALEAQFGPMCTLLREENMRQVRNPQMTLGEVHIEDIELDLKSRDDIPACCWDFSISTPTSISAPGCSPSWTNTSFPASTGRSGGREWRCGGSS